jgi:hypothetical protein
MALLVAIGVWLGITGLFFGAPGLVLEGGYGDIWILAILAAPGFLLWSGAAQSRSPRINDA